MIIAVDIDDVITDTSLSLIAHAKLHETEVCEKGEILDHLAEIMRGGFPSPAVKKYFYRFMAEIMAEAKVKEGAAEVLSRLKEKGHTLVFITARGEKRYPGSTEVTKKFIAEEQLPCDAMVFDSVDKLEDCRSYRVDLLIDDSVKNCTDVAAGGIRTLLFTSAVNKETETALDRVENWQQLEKYIDNM